jgi:sulfane dehydrogenase subunit SoxC
MQPGHSLSQTSRRRFLRVGAFWSAMTVACRSGKAPPDAAQSRVLGAPVSAYGGRSRFEKAARFFNRDTKVPLEEASSRTPLHETYGIITPSSLHFERHHAGVPDLDPAAHTLTVHGLVERPLIFSVADLKRLPSVSRIHFIECSGNSGTEWRGGAVESAVQRSHGLTSCSEWTGVPVAVLLRECRVRAEGTWILAEGADACRMARSIPMNKIMDDALVAFAQNGEPLRPEQGYPMRLLLPGWEGNANVKWLRRIEVLDTPVMTRDETSKYTDLMPDGTARQFTFVMEAKSLITRPSGGETLPGPGVYELTGIAWSGRGVITRVEITTDGGQTWTPAELQDPVLARAHTRFRWTWRWDGRETVFASRCTDETGYTQPTISELVSVRGTNSQYHNNGIQAWRIAADGRITNGNRV